MSLFNRHTPTPDPEVLFLREMNCDLVDPEKNHVIMRCVGAVAVDSGKRRHDWIPQPIPVSCDSTSTDVRGYRIPEHLVRGVESFAHERAVTETVRLKRRQNCESFAYTANGVPVPDDFGIAGHPHDEWEFEPLASRPLLNGTTLRFVPEGTGEDIQSFLPEEHWAVVIDGGRDRLLHVPAIDAPLAVDSLTNVLRARQGAQVFIARPIAH